MTVPLPVYNRNQGNIERAKINATQTQLELAALERQIADEVDEAVREFNLSREAMLELERRSSLRPSGSATRPSVGSREARPAPSIISTPRKITTRSSASIAMRWSGIAGACSI